MEIEKWLNELPEPYRTKALANCKQPDLVVEDVLQALANGFLWGDTIEGEDYWNDAYLTIEAAKLDDEYKEEQNI